MLDKPEMKGQCFWKDENGTTNGIILKNVERILCVDNSDDGPNASCSVWMYGTRHDIPMSWVDVLRQISLRNNPDKL